MLEPLEAIIMSDRTSPHNSQLLILIRWVILMVLVSLPVDVWNLNPQKNFGFRKCWCLWFGGPPTGGRRDLLGGKVPPVVECQGPTACPNQTRNTISQQRFRNLVSKRLRLFGQCCATSRLRPKARSLQALQLSSLSSYWSPGRTNCIRLQQKPKTTG